MYKSALVVFMFYMSIINNLKKVMLKTNVDYFLKRSDLILMIRNRVQTIASFFPIYAFLYSHVKRQK